MADLPILVTAAGLQPRSPASILADLIARVTSTNPGYTANLPGSLIEDISSTDVAAIVECDSAVVETINSFSPSGANAFLLLQLGTMLGVTQGVGSNTSVLVVFSGDPGFVIGSGFLVSDGTFQYQVQAPGGIIAANGQTLPMLAIATISGSWAVPAGTVTKLITSIPSNVNCSVVNTDTGIPGAGSETQASYRARVMQANLAASQGMARYLRTLLSQVPNVQPRLIQPLQQSGPSGGWMIIVGGGDPYLVAFAVMTALFDIATLVGSQLNVLAVTAALPAVATTDLNHGIAISSPITIAGATPAGYNGNFVVMAVPGQKQITLGKAFNLNNIVAATWAATAGGQVTFTTNTPHGVTVGSSFSVAGMTPAGYNATFTAIAGTTGSTLVAALTVNPGAATVFGQLQPGNAFFDGTGLVYGSGGFITPNPRNLSVSVNDYPDSYKIPIVIPPQQSVSITVTWGTTSPNFVSNSAVAQTAGPAIANYINSILVGQPIHELLLQDAFEKSIIGIFPEEFISVLTFAVSINGIGTPVTAGTHLFSGDPQSFFFARNSDISFIRV